MPATYGRGYTRIKVLGKGAFGEAVLVKNSGGKYVVLKQVQLAQLTRKEQKEAENEIAILKRLNHPNIVSYVESFVEARVLCIVMEYVDGGDLAQRLKSRNGVLMKEDEILHIFMQLCLAVKNLHDQHVLHRDLKTQNIFLSAHKTHPIVKLGDFGISTSLQNTMALARTMCGTPYYFSPELCQNRPYNNKSDVWSLGCVLYEMCSLRHAFDGSTMQSLMARIVKGQYKPLSKALSDPLHRVVDCMLIRDVRSRPSINRILSLEWMQGKVRSFVEAPLPVTSPERIRRQRPLPGKKPSGASLEKSQKANNDFIEMLQCKQDANKNRKLPQRRMTSPAGAPQTAPPTPPRKQSADDRLELLKQQAARHKAEADKRMNANIKREEAERRNVEARRQAEERIRQHQDFELLELKKARQREMQKMRDAKPKKHSGRDGWMKIDEHVSELKRQMDAEAPSKFAMMKGIPANPFMEARLAAQANRNRPCNPFRTQEERNAEEQRNANVMWQQYAGSPKAQNREREGGRIHKQEREAKTPPSEVLLVSPPRWVPHEEKKLDLDALLAPFSGPDTGGHEEPCDDAMKLWRQHESAISNGRKKDEEEERARALWEERKRAYEKKVSEEQAPVPPPGIPSPFNMSPRRVSEVEVQEALEDEDEDEDEELINKYSVAEFRAIQDNLRSAVLDKELDDCYFEEAPVDAPFLTPPDQDTTEALIREHLIAQIGEGAFAAAFRSLKVGDDAAAARVIEGNECLFPLFKQLLYCVNLKK
eukprot:TRINITY_DN5624_c0_g1_i1.p1 TRINITY_DN5624_c0_g1~~TRINITY_DN5624_c0_g1_i1.p1  ORF type:complete len:764 (+),score=173.73 TRINITY_DN5624_c0_g1_i1:29-2320(+)